MRKNLTSRYISLVLYMSYSDLRAESERFYAGYLWWFADPIIQMLVYYVVFAIFLNKKTTDFIAFLLVGLVAWRWFQSTLMHAAKSILAGRSLISQVYIPTIVFPTSSILSNTFKFLIVLSVLLFFLWAYGFAAGPAYLVLPLVILVQLMFILGMAYLASAVVPFFPDLLIVIDNFLRAMLFLSGVFYKGSTLSPGVRSYFYLNPMASIIESYRAILIDGAWPCWSRLSAIAAASTIAIFAGIMINRYFDRQYAKVNF